MSDMAREMMARIEAGARIESAHEMTDDYRDNLIHLLTMQADSELAGGYGYVPWITKAPTVEEKHVVAQIVKDELRHAAVMYGLLADLGFDVASHVRRHDAVFTMRISSDADIGTARITSDKRVNIFYYPIETWADFVFFNFCMDRGRPPARRRPRLLLRPLGARDRGNLQRGEVPHSPRRVLGEEA